jgi:polygalacturonase
MNRNYILNWLLVVFFVINSSLYAQTAYIAPELPIIPGKTFVIKDFGAKGDDITDDTRAIQTAIDSAISAGGGKVILTGGSFLCGPLHFSSNLNFCIDSGAVLKMLPKDQYPGGTDQGLDFISGSKLHDIVISGKGTIDGQGSPWWPFAKIEGIKRPRMITFKDCDKILIEQVKLLNAPMFHIAISGKTTNVTVRKVTISAPASDDPVNPSHNTDACDVTGKNILIEDCDVSVGDDNYTCGGNTSDVMIRNNKYGYGHGLSIGSYTRGGVSNFTVENCTFTNTESGIRIKSSRGRGGLVQNITYKNITMTNVGIPILVYSVYENKDRQFRDLKKLSPEVAATLPAETITEQTPIYKDITFQNITATTQKGRRAGLIWGLPEAPISNVVMQNVVIDSDDPFGIYFGKDIKLINCIIRTKVGLNKILTTNANVSIDGKEIK